MSQSQNSGKTTKQLDRLAPNLAHIFGFIWEWISAKKNCFETPGGHFGFLGGHKMNRLGNLTNGWIEWHQIWHRSADSSGNGHRLKQISPVRHQGKHFDSGLSRGNILGFLGLIFINNVENAMICREKIKCTNIIILELTRAKPGNPASSSIQSALVLTRLVIMQIWLQCGRSWLSNFCLTVFIIIVIFNLLWSEFVETNATFRSASTGCLGQVTDNQCMIKICRSKQIEFSHSFRQTR